MNRKLIFISKQAYKEVLLDDFDGEIRVGTDVGSDIRFKRSEFLASFSFLMTPYKDVISVKCGEDLYIKSSSDARLSICNLELDNFLDVYYSDGDIHLFEIRCIANYDHVSSKYDRKIEIASMQLVRIGASANCNIILEDASTGKDEVSLEKQNGQWTLNILRVGCGTMVNGRRTRGAALTDHDFFSIGPYIFCFLGNALYTSSHQDMRCQGVQYVDLGARDRIGTLEYPCFNRSTRMYEQLDDEPIKVLDPPSIPPEPNDNVIMQILPAIATLVLVVVMRGFMGNDSNIAFVLLSICTMAVGVLTTVYGIINARKKYNEDIEHRQMVYNNYIKQKQNDIEASRAEEVALLQRQYVSSREELKMVDGFDPRLFEKKPGDKDFLEVCLGRGRHDAIRPITYKEREEVEIKDELTTFPEKIAEEYKVLDQVPITLNLLAGSPVGIFGNRRNMYEILKTMVLDIATRHYHDEVQMLFAIGPEDKERFDWLRYLPHVQNEALQCRNIICDSISRSAHFEALYKSILTEEQPNKYTVVFIYRDNGIYQHPIAEMMELASQKNIVFVLFSEYREQLPNNCKYIIQVETDRTGTRIDVQQSNKAQAFTYDPITEGEILAVAERLAPVYCKEIELEGELTKNISLFELLHIFSPEDIPLEQQWERSTVDHSLAAPIGIRSNGSIVALDLHEKAHGPHGLVAGTTGSGKSQALQTLILSLALYYPPEDVEFILIDYKGGGMANQFKRLPHLVGTITDIDGKGISRSLKALQAEQKKREELFARYGTEDQPIDHIDKYIKLYKKNREMTPLPHLIIIADEFGELKMEQPDFMKELISIARKGRSLGIHLILATQKPSGLVDPQIWSNSRFKLCLKVQSREDSMEVLKTPAASEITNAGRAYLQVGNNEIFELFQTAYSGGAANTIGNTQQKEFAIYSVSFEGRRKCVYERKNTIGNEEVISQQQSVINYIADYCGRTGVKPLPQICIPALETVIYRPAQSQCSAVVGGLVAEIGLYDDPAHQLQGVQTINITQENTLIIGSSQYGKTNLLQVILCDLAERYTPSQVNVYILDFGTMIFRNYAALPHIGGVVCANEDEKVKNLFRLLNEEMTTRKEKLLNAGVSSYAAYLEAGFEDIPQIVLMVDNLTGLREMYLDDSDLLLPICRDGSALGISVIIANLQMTGVASSYRYLPNLPRRIAFTCNEISEYSILFNTSRVAPTSLPGRCMVMREKELCEVQCYLPFDGEREFERVAQILSFVDKICRDYGQHGARRIPEIPAEVNEASLRDSFGVENDMDRMYIGVDYDTMDPVAVEWGTRNVLAVSGRAEYGRQAFAAGLAREIVSHGGTLLVMDDNEGALSFTRDMPGTELYTRSLADAGELLKRMEQYMNQRYAEREGGLASTKALAPVVLMVQNREMMTRVDEDRALTGILERLAGKYVGLKGAIVFTDFENEAIGFRSPAGLKALQKSMRYLVFEDCEKIKAVSVTTNDRRRFARQLVNGEAYYSDGEKLSKLRVARYS